MEQNKPNAPMIVSDGNIFIQLAIVSKAQRENGLRDEVIVMSNRVYRADSYDEALRIITEYVEPVDKLEYMQKNRDRNMGMER